MIRLRKSRRDCVARRAPLSFGLAGLVWVQVQFDLVPDDRFPRKIPAQGFVQILPSDPVHREEDKRVSVEPRGVPAHFQDFLLRRASAAIGPPLSNSGCSAESTTSRASRSSGTSAPDKGSKWIRSKSPAAFKSTLRRFSSSAATSSGLAPHQFSAVFGQLGDCGLRGIPHPGAVLVQIGSPPPPAGAARRRIWPVSPPASRSRA